MRRTNAFSISVQRGGGGGEARRHLRQHLRCVETRRVCSAPNIMPRKMCIDRRICVRDLPHSSFAINHLDARVFRASSQGELLNEPHVSRLFGAPCGASADLSPGPSSRAGNILSPDERRAKRAAERQRRQFAARCEPHLSETRVDTGAILFGAARRTWRAIKARERRARETGWNN